MMKLVRLFAAAVLPLWFMAAAFWSVRLGVVDAYARRGDAAGLRKAIAAMPGQAEYHARLALVESTEAPREAAEALGRAVSLNPADSRSWIELGLRYETERRIDLAERCLLRAAAEDGQHLPRWTLANFYLRQDNADRFWEWARESAATIPGDPRPLFRLCHRLEGSVNLIDRLAIARPAVRAAYLAYVLGEPDRAEWIAGACERVLDSGGAADVPVMLTACDRLLELDRVDDALGIWNRLAATGRVGAGRLEPRRGVVLTNGGFRATPVSHGFDWRLRPLDGLALAAEDDPPGIRVTFSGRQPESCEPLSQFIPVEEDTAYTLRFRYRTSGIAPGAGLRWRVADAKGRTILDGQSLSAEEERRGDLTFRTPPGCRLATLSLTYTRMPGTTRADGYAVIRNVELTPAGGIR